METSDSMSSSHVSQHSNNVISQPQQTHQSATTEHKLIDAKTGKICNNSNENDQPISDNNSHHCTNEEALEEEQAFFDTYNTFKCYESAAKRRIRKSLNFIKSMSANEQERLIEYRQHLRRCEEAVAVNQQLIDLIIQDVPTLFMNAHYMTETDRLVVKDERAYDTDRINSVLSQVVREWTARGAEERNTCFKHILEPLQRYYPFTDAIDRARVRVLVPGAGLGRLMYEIALLGYSCQGNEFSLMMLFVAHFILNKCTEANAYHFHPWALHFVNNLRCSDQLERLTFPDVCPTPETTANAGSDFSMGAGSFTDVYHSEENREQFDVVATCFFIDTAANILDYIKTIRLVLKNGGLWINFGPLLYHFADTPEPSIEPSYEIVRALICGAGFEYLEERTNIECYYTRRIHSMLHYQYKAVYFVCRKKSDST